MEISLNLPWNLAPTPAGMASHVRQNAGEPVSMHLAYLPVTITIALLVACSVSIVSGITTSARLARMKVREALKW
jgi:ABC-type antimicrobial peptide transport system permease subunit